MVFERMKENRTQKDSESENAKGVEDDLIKKIHFVILLNGWN